MRSVFSDQMTQMSILPRAIYPFSALPFKIPMMFFAEVEMSIIVFMWNLKKPETTKTILKENKVVSLILPDFKLTIKL